MTAQTDTFELDYAWRIIALFNDELEARTRERDEALREFERMNEALSRAIIDKAAARARVEAVEAALRYYANEDGWTYDTVYEDHGYTSSTPRRAVDDDDVDSKGAGKRARAALATPPATGHDAGGEA